MVSFPPALFGDRFVIFHANRVLVPKRRSAS
jgi:hypothetical protein